MVRNEDLRIPRPKVLNARQSNEAIRVMRHIVQVTTAMPLNSEEPTATLEKMIEVKAPTAIKTFLAAVWEKEIGRERQTDRWSKPCGHAPRFSIKVQRYYRTARVYYLHLMS
ncbi:hypothetical protein PoB_000475900 [Plakobranchus ocellatus]|uniref:Uncharacterized protein n=1 Tax=Plakobranchus ocellatus TaxID=259542 RepID=A0AAV3Y5Q1_9GAST|nr:hypothetical protein PoB_000475900 [Plakobranchus ocellatus]